jgi:hypothetical protein
MRELRRFKSGEIRDLAAKALEQGGRLRSGGSHAQIACPWYRTDRCVNTSGLVTLSTSPSDRKTVRASTADLRRCGYEI